MYFTSRFLVPRKSGEVSAADVLELYLRRVKEDIGLSSGRLLWTGNRKSFVAIPLGKNTIGKVPSDMATQLHIDQSRNYTFQSFRRSAATAVADAGATSNQMQNFLEWSHSKMAEQYITTSKAAMINVARKLQNNEAMDVTVAEVAKWS